jgi:nicotinate phosphoribosyltransferase
MPNNSIFLVGTYDSVEGVRHAIEAGEELRRRGHDLDGVRLDSGDLAALSRTARRLLDDAGFPGARIVASGDLDEEEIARLAAAGARIDVWGVGTRLVTGHRQPALGGVYKLGGVRAPGGGWEHRLKLSEQVAKISTPGQLQVRRFARRGVPVGDVLWDEWTGIGASCTAVDRADPRRRRRFGGNEHTFEDLLVPVLRRGRRVGEETPLTAVQERARAQLATFPEAVKRLSEPRWYPLATELGLHQLTERLVREARADVAHERERPRGR